MLNNHNSTYDIDNKYYLSVALAMVVGVLVAGASILFMMAFQNITTYLYVEQTQAQLVDGFVQWHWWLLVILPAAGLVVGLLSYYVMPTRKNIGLTGVIDAVHNRGGKINLREGVGVGLVSAVSIGAGASVGRYGPAVHVGASIGSWLAQVFKLDRNAHLMLLACGVAAAISASFNAPFAGVIFAHELIIRNYNIRSFAPVTLASIIGVVLGRMFSADSVYSGFTFPAVTSVGDYSTAILIGIVCALVGMLFLKTLLTSVKVGAKVNIHPIIKPVIGGIILAVIGMIVPHTLGLGGHVVNSILENISQYGILILFAILIAKILAISISFGMGFNGGLFAPALFLGVISASLVLAVLHNFGINNFSVASTMVLVGAGCLISVVFGAPIATTVIVLELTNSYSVASAVLMGVVVTRIIVNSTFSTSYLDHLLEKQGVDVAVSREKELMADEPVNLHMQKDFISVSADATNEQLTKKMLSCNGKQELFIVDASNKLVGVVRSIDLLRMPNANAREAMHDASYVLSSIASISEAIDHIDQFSGLSVPITNETGVLVGIILESNLIRVYKEVSQQIYHERS